MGKTFLYGLAIMIKNNYLSLKTLKQQINNKLKQLKNTILKKLLLVLLALPLIGFGQCTSGNCFNGYGVFTSSEGTYKGNWKNGKVHGTGVFVGFFKMVVFPFKTMLSKSL